jgi:hypothetical protein
MAHASLGVSMLSNCAASADDELVIEGPVLDLLQLRAQALQLPLVLVADARQLGQRGARGGRQRA